MNDGHFSCPIWGTPAEDLGRSGDWLRVKSARAGGIYTITGTASKILTDPTFVEWKKVALTEQIFLAQRQKFELKIDSYFIDRLRELSELSVQEKLNRFFVTICDRFPTIGEEFLLDDFKAAATGQEVLPAIRAAGSFFDHWQEISLYLDAMIGKKFLEGAQSRDSKRSFARVSLDGWTYYEDLGISLSKSDQVFVAMWFGSEEQTNVYNQSIAPAILDAGYKPVRIDNKEHNDKIDDAIIAEIRKSKAVVVDMTCGLANPIGDWSNSEKVGAPRGGVFYEAGFAAGLRLPVIWTVKQEIAEIENVVHFDVRQFNQIRWTNDFGDFRTRLKNRIEATLGRGSFASLT